MTCAILLLLKELEIKVYFLLRIIGFSSLNSFIINCRSIVIKSNVLSHFRHLKEIIICILVHLLKYTSLSSLKLYYLMKRSQKHDLTASHIRALLEHLRVLRKFAKFLSGIFAVDVY